MALFRRDPVASTSPRETGVAHIKLCGDLCVGVNAASEKLNAPLPAAVEALPKAALLRWDDDMRAAKELLVGWIDAGIGKPSVHARYIFGHSIFRAAFDQRARGSLT